MWQILDHTVLIHKPDCDHNAKWFERELEAWRTIKYDHSGTASDIPEAFSVLYKTEIRLQHVLMGGWFSTVHRLYTLFKWKGMWGRRCKDHTGEVVPFGKVSLVRNHSEDGSTLNIKWMRGVGRRAWPHRRILVVDANRSNENTCREALLKLTMIILGHFLNLCTGSRWNAAAKSTPQEFAIQQKGRVSKC